MPAQQAQRASPDALLARAKKEQRGRLKIFLGAAPGRRQDLRHADGRPRGQGRGARCGGGRRRDARPRRDRGAARRPRGAAAQADRLRQPHPERVRHRRRARPAPGAAAGRRIRPHQHPRQPPSQALAGCRGAARRRHRRVDHAQRPAPGKPQRRGAEDHAGARARDRARSACSRRPTRSCWSTCRPTSC